MFFLVFHLTYTQSPCLPSRYLYIRKLYVCRLSNLYNEWFVTLCQSHVTEQEFDAIKAISSSNVRFQQLKDVIKRINKCSKRLQLRFPSVFRDGVLIQFLTKFIKLNENIKTFACGLSSNYSPGFNALNEILSLPNLTRFNFRILDLSVAPRDFFNSISQSKMKKLYLKFDTINDENMKLLCYGLQQNNNLKHFTFSCKSLSDESIRYFADFCGNSNVHTLSVSIDTLENNQIEMICDGISKSKYIRHLDIEDCHINCYGMKVLCNTLKDCMNITTLTIGNNGRDSMKAFFGELAGLQYINTLICNESQLLRAERIDLDIVSSALNEVNKFNKLSVLQLPLFIFDDTTEDSLKSFVDALSNKDNKIETLQLFPLFEHLDKASFTRNPIFCGKISYFFHLLFNGLSNSQCLKKLYIEMIGSETNFFTKQVANSFQDFLLNSKINELYIPFCCLIDLNDEILNNFINCKELVSIKDDTLDTN